MLARWLSHLNKEPMVIRRGDRLDCVVEMEALPVTHISFWSVAALAPLCHIKASANEYTRKAAPEPPHSKILCVLEVGCYIRYTSRTSLRVLEQLKFAHNRYSNNQLSAWFYTGRLSHRQCKDWW